MEHVLITIITLAAYFLPSLIALVRNHHNKTAIIVSTRRKELGMHTTTLATGRINIDGRQTCR